MPHPEREHELMIEVARLQKRVDDGDATARILVKDVRAWSDTCDKLRESLAAANARADAAVAEIVNEQRRFGEMQREAWKLEEALAAARRDAEALRKALSDLIQEMKFGGGCDGTDPSCDGCVAVEAARAALAAPADGEEGTR